MEEIMVGFVMSVIEKWSKVVVFVLEPAFYYLFWCYHGNKVVSEYSRFSEGILPYVSL